MVLSCDSCSVLNNEEANMDQGFAANEVVTSKYTFWSFLPLFLWENLNPWNKFANFYFVCVAICEVIEFLFLYGSLFL